MKIRILPSTKFSSVKEYISVFPKETQILLKELRQTIIDAAPDAEEVISYNMPAFKLGGMLVYYAGYEKHIGFYPMPAAIREFHEELTKYKTSKGAIQFPIEKGIPKGLVKKMVKFRVKENLEAEKLKKEKKKK